MGQMNDWDRFNEQFREDAEERNERLRKARNARTSAVLWRLIADLSICLTDEGADFSNEGLASLRQRVANALPPDQCPDWLARFRDPPITHG